MVDSAQEADGDTPILSSICPRCANACITCSRCELPLDDMRDMETTLAPNNIIIDCNKFIMRGINEEETNSNDVGEGIHFTERRVLSDGLRGNVVEWEEDEENGQIYIRIQLDRKTAEGNCAGKEDKD